MINYAEVVSGSLIFLLFGSIIALWKRNGDTNQKLDSKVSHQVCKNAHEHQAKINTELITKVAVIETKLDLGFSRIEDKIEKNGRKDISY